MKIYDCFTFFNELEILEIRLKELYNVVDHFVIVESNSTFRGNTKEFVLAKHWERFTQFHDKIRYIQVTDIPHCSDTRQFTHYKNYCVRHNLDSHGAWTREAYQRDCITRGLYDITDDSWVIISDCDEVPRAKSLRMLETITDNPRVVLNLALFYFKLNYLNRDSYRWSGPVAVKAHQFTSPQHERSSIQQSRDNKLFLEHAGWHWSYMGDDNTIKYKLQNFSHAEHDTAEMMSKICVSHMINNHVNMFGSTNYCCLKITDYWPNCVTRDLNTKYQNAIAIDNNMIDIFDIYPET